MKRQFVTVDVFTDRKFGGNPLAVFPDAQGLSTEQMQAIAAEFNYAETTFVLPPKDAKNTAEVRIFTPRAEMPFAGPPNVGTAYVPAQEHGVEIQARMFAPLFGVPEDPATGSANVTLIGLLAHLDKRADFTLSKTIGQGFDMGRPSVLEAMAEKKSGKVTATYIG